MYDTINIKHLKRDDTIENTCTKNMGTEIRCKISVTCNFDRFYRLVQRKDSLMKTVSH